MRKVAIILLILLIPASAPAQEKTYEDGYWELHSIGLRGDELKKYAFQLYMERLLAPEKKARQERIDRLIQDIDNSRMQYQLQEINEKLDRTR